MSAGISLKEARSNLDIFLFFVNISNNEFTFHGKSYRQVIGALMGAVASPEICDIAIYNHINTILENSPIREKILFHKRMRELLERLSLVISIRNLFSGFIIGYSMSTCSSSDLCIACVISSNLRLVYNDVIS
jgi:hypothetical protein